MKKTLFLLFLSLSFIAYGQSGKIVNINFVSIPAENQTVINFDTLQNVSVHLELADTAIQSISFKLVNLTDLSIVSDSLYLWADIPGVINNSIYRLQNHVYFNVLNRSMLVPYSAEITVVSTNNLSSVLLQEF